MGAANVIPGVSGGTIALITGIYERLINALKSFDLKALKLLTSLKIKELLLHIDFYFLFSVFAGIAVSILSLAKLLQYLFEYYPVLLWAFFFGLILASVLFIGKKIKKWNPGTVTIFLLGVAIAVVITFLKPASENSSALYLFICGVIVICSMILPGLSGSFVLIILGNYFLLLQAVTTLNFSILIPMGIGCVVGLIAFSHFLSWVFKKFHDLTLAILTGFIMGSLVLLWPWKEAVYLTINGEVFLKNGKPKVMGYDWQLPDTFGGIFPSNFQFETWLAFILIVLGFAIVWALDKFSVQSEK
jgi:putative membrane protein